MRQATGPNDLSHLVGNRVGPYNSFNAVSAVQIWQWCSAMGDRNPLYLDASYREQTEFKGSKAVAPPAMMQVWTMRDFDDNYAADSTDAHPYQVMRDLEELGFTANVAVSYDLTFHRYLVEGDRVHHYKSVASISEHKTTALGNGHFFTDRMEYFDARGELFAEALITYFQYRPAAAKNSQPGNRGENETAVAGEQTEKPTQSWQPDFEDLNPAALTEGTTLPPLEVPITHKLVVGGAIATQDFIPVHHNVPAAQAAAMPDIFMNILTSCGLCARYLSDWAGPGSRLRRLTLRLMAPNSPGDSMTLQGEVKKLDNNVDTTEVSVDFSGINSLGPHVMGSAVLQLAAPASP